MTETTFNFSVASDLLRELGERLVGRQSVALGELIKNAFDADATTCTVRIAAGGMEISDNGHGMSLQEFGNYWMRIGSTHKVLQARSRDKKRSLTGSKGIGRLAVQFLADTLEITTVSKRQADSSLQIFVDWRKAQQHEDLTKFEVRCLEQSSKGIAFPGGSRWGFSLRLGGLRQKWSVHDIEELARDVWMLRSPFAQLAPARADQDFQVLLFSEDDRAAQRFDEIFDSVLEGWQAQVRGKIANGMADAKAHISVSFAEGYGDSAAETFDESIDLPIRHREGALTRRALINDLEFVINIFLAAGRQREGIKVDDLRSYLHNYGGIHIYDGSFRLPHYGGRDDEDWLAINADHARRISASQLLPAHLQVNRMMLDLPSSRRMFGIVSISTREEAEAAARRMGDRERALQINASRDRLVDNLAFKQLADVVRFSLDFYASRYRTRALRNVERDRSSQSRTLRVNRLQRVVEAHRGEIPAITYSEIKKEVDDYVKSAVADDKYRESAAALLAPLATAGMSALALSHELTREMRNLDDIVCKLNTLSEHFESDELALIGQQLGEWHGRTTALQGLFSPLASEDDREDLDRFRVDSVVDTVRRAMIPLLPNVRLVTDLKGHPELRFPEGTMAEWTAVFQNIFSNAWNAMLDSVHSEILVRSIGLPRKRVGVIVADTGVGLSIPIKNSDRLFEPFARALRVPREYKSLMLGGHGLGLAITRMIARRRGAEIRFINPPRKYATAIELSWPHP